MMQGLPRKSPARSPWGSVAALLAACFATLAGLVRGIDPDVILWRALVAAALVGTLWAVVSGVAQRILTSGSTKSA